MGSKTSSKYRLLFMALLWVWGLACGPGPSPGELERVLKASWRSYVRHYITPEGRVKISEGGEETISEGQAYALLRAVWAGDEATFARVYAWTHHNLGRAKTLGDSLLSWHWGRHPDGSQGVLDANTASDADLDYALALVLAHRRGWKPPPGLPAYAEEAQRVAGAILEKEVVTLPGGDLLLTPGNWHEPGPPYLVNPSYFSPGTYRVLAQVDGDSRWTRLQGDTYGMLGRLTQGWGDGPGKVLVPDWCRVDAQGRPGPAPERGHDFGWEAVRLPFRVALDGRWFQSREAREWAVKFLPFFKQEWAAQGRLAAVYRLDGTPAATYESPVLYAGVLAAALIAGEQEFARQLAQKILSSFREEGDRAYFDTPDNYYANNWAWLGLALYAGWVKPLAP
jgi:endoglucanase